MAEIGDKYVNGWIFHYWKQLHIVENGWKWLNFLEFLLFFVIIPFFLLIISSCVFDDF